MENLAPAKRFRDVHNTSGMPSVHVRRPIPLRDLPLPGTKKMNCPPHDSPAMDRLLRSVANDEPFSPVYGIVAFTLSSAAAVLMSLAMFMDYLGWKFLGGNILEFLPLLLVLAPSAILLAHLKTGGRDEWSLRGFLLFFLGCPLVALIYVCIS